MTNEIMLTRLANEFEVGRRCTCGAPILDGQIIHHVKTSESDDGLEQSFWIMHEGCFP